MLIFMWNLVVVAQCLLSPSTSGYLFWTGIFPAFSDSISGTITVANIAMNKPSSQSSDYENNPAKLAVDGNLDTAMSGKSCAHTNDDISPWWMVDLGTPSLVKKVYIVNRGDCCGERLSGFEIRVGEYHRLFCNVFIDTTELRKIFLTMTALRVHFIEEISSLKAFHLQQIACVVNSTT